MPIQQMLLATGSSSVNLSDNYWMLNYTEGQTTYSMQEGNGVAVDNTDGSVYVCGYHIANPSGTTTEDTIIAKFDITGVLQWQRKLDAGTNSYNNSRGKSLAVDSSGNVYICGHAQLYGSGGIGNVDAFLVKFNSSGVLQWERLLGSSGEAEYFTDIKIDSSDNIYVVGHHYLDPASGDQPMMIAKYNTSGTVQWYKFFGTNYYGGSTSQRQFEGLGIDTDSSGNVYICGYLKNVYGANYEAYLVKYDSSGNEQFFRMVTSGSFAEYFRGVAVDSSDNVYAVGTTNSNPQGGGVMGLVVKWNSSGTLQWQRQIGENTGATWARSQNFYRVKVDSSDNIIVAGTHYTYNTTNQGQEAFVMKFNSSGTIQWQRSLGHTYNGSDYVFPNTYAYGLALDIEDNFYLCGIETDSANTSGFYSRLNLVKLPSDGSYLGRYGTFNYRATALVDFTANSILSFHPPTSPPTIYSTFTRTLTEGTSSYFTDSANNFVSETSAVYDGTSTTSIVTDNLEFHIDAGVTTSYSGSGTSLNSLVNGYSAEGGSSEVTYSTHNGGHFQIPYSMSYYGGWYYGIAFMFRGLGWDFGSGDFTVEMWIRPTGSNMGMVVEATYAQGNASSSSTGRIDLWYYTKYNSSGAHYVFRSYDSNGANNTMWNSNGFEELQTSYYNVHGSMDWRYNRDWFHVVITSDVSTTTRKHYINGSLKYTYNDSMNDEIRSYGVANNTLLSLGGAIGSNNPYEGDMAIVRLYKGKALSASEVSQNYDVDKNRFGTNTY